MHDKVIYNLIKAEWGKPTKRNGEENPAFVREVKGPDSFHGQFSPEFLKKKNEEGYHIYYYPNFPSDYNADSYPSGTRINGKHIDVFRWVFLDMDLKDGIYKTKEEFLAHLTATFELKPSKIVDSGNGLHVYWRVLDLDRETFMFVNRALLEAYKTDDSVWTPLQLMRHPGFFNVKDPSNYKPAKQIIEGTDSKAMYKVEKFVALLPDVSEEGRRKIQIHLNMLDGVSQVNLDELGGDPEELPLKFQKDLDTNKRIYDLFNHPKETHGDRSGADAVLCNLLFNMTYSKEDAFRVMFNTEKARSRADRERYAGNLVDKVYGDRPTNVIHPSSEFEERTKNVNEVPVLGPIYMDAPLGNRWVRQQALGLIAPPGIGKTTITLSIIRDCIQNNPDRDDIYMFVSLEMTEREIVRRWKKLTNDDPFFANRLFILANEDYEGNQRHLGLQDIYHFARDTQLYHGKEIAVLAIDHIGLINRVIDLKREPNFGVEAFARPNSRTAVMTEAELCKRVKELAKMLNCFMIVQSQTTKTKAGAGDLPLDKSSAFGTSAFEQNMDFIITCWQPMIRVQYDTNLRITAWQYCKIREKHENDEIREMTPYLLKFEPATGEFGIPTSEETTEALELIDKANKLRVVEEKKQTLNYRKAPVKRLRLILNARNK